MTRGRWELTRRAASAALIAGLGAACSPKASERAPTLLEGRFADWTQDILSDDPELATLSGVSDAVVGGRFAHRLTERGPEAVERRRTASLRRIVELRAIGPSPASPEADALPVVSAQFEAAAGLARFDYGAFSPLGGAQPYAIDQSAAAFLTLPDFLESRQPMASLDEAGDYLARLAAVPAALEGQTAHAEADAGRGVVAPAFILQRTRDLLAAALGQPAEASAFYTGFARRIDALTPPPVDSTQANDAQRRAAALKAHAFSLVRDRIQPALARMAGALGPLAARAGEEAGVWRLPDGEAYYAAALALETTTTLSPQEIHQIGLDRVAELSGTLDAALRRMGRTEGGIGARMAALTAEPAYRYVNDEAGREQLMADVRDRIDRARAVSAAWFGALPKAALEVRRVPALAEATASGAYYEPPAIDESAPGVYYINLRDTAEMTRIDLPTQDYHEAIPGHHLQIALAREQTELPLLRRLMSFNAYTEGWALYAEQLAEEQGLHDRDPIGRLGYLRWQLWRAARLVVDTGLHALRWNRAQAVATLAEITGDLPGVIETEVDRYVAAPGQACGYELGRREIARLREAARRTLGARFTLKGFHDQVLGGGELPLGLLTQRIEAWTAAQSQVAPTGSDRRDTR